MFEKMKNKLWNKNENMFDKCIDDFSTNNNMNKPLRKKHQSYFDVKITEDEHAIIYVIATRRTKIKYIDVIVDGDYLIVKYEKNQKIRTKNHKSSKCHLQIKRYYLGKKVTDINKESVKDKIIVTINKKEN